MSEPPPPRQPRDGSPFRLIVELEPPSVPRLDGVTARIEALAPHCSDVLVPDNHLGRSTLSGLEVARRAVGAGLRPIACLNARDRNQLGLERDLLTASALGIEDVLFVRGDAPTRGERSDLTVAAMVDIAHAVRAELDRPLRIGLTAPSGALRWRAAADFLVGQVLYDAEAIAEWRGGLDFDGDVYAAVLMPASASMAKSLNARNIDVRVPPDLVNAFDADPEAGVSAGFALIEALEAGGITDGAYVIAGRRLGPVIERLRARSRR